MTATVSIIINNYNYGRFLRGAIDSALNQTYPDKEVIVVDDGSTDNSREIIAGYGDRIIPVLKPNGGQGSAFNAGFAASHGGLIFLLDSDDFFYPEKVAIVQKIMSSEFAGKQTLLYHLLDVVDQSGRNQGTTLPPEFHPLQLNWLDYARKFAHVPFVASPTSGLAISRGLAQQIFPIPEVRTSADDFVVGAAALLGEVHGIPEALAAFRMHGANRWFFSQLQLKPREFMHEYEKYLNARLVKNHLDPVIDYFGSPLSIRYAEGSFSRLSRLGWTAVKRRHSPGMILFFLKTEFKALRCLLKDCLARVHRAAFGFVRRTAAVGAIHELPLREECCGNTERRRERQS